MEYFEIKNKWFYRLQLIVQYTGFRLWCRPGIWADSNADPSAKQYAYANLHQHASPQPYLHAAADQHVHTCSHLHT